MKKGSFTGANKEGKMGLVEAADGGTLFLDEINSRRSVFREKFSELWKKNRFRGRFHKNKKSLFPLYCSDKQEPDSNGSRWDIPGRFILPSSGDSADDPASEGEARGHRSALSAFPFIISASSIIWQKNLSEQVLETLKNYDWPGNVREIRNFAERIVVMTPKAVKEINCIPPEILESHAGTLEREALPDTPTQISVRRSYTNQSLTKDEVMHALEVCRGHREQTAQYLGISKRKLQYMIKEYRNMRDVAD